ncbi:hypothetical protein IGI04_007125 [Brassica rapa subsp. trilocularis]|uniref:Uncharacterized protein n=1 Tax=Brassica rapa subsp. trilocularis TaxID=1813537 RepID=A0ABQ7NIU6_BRACM|nr:hypothetical protein IGI04_007125 [Brassica rapa subsp. trilocularis]
MITVNWSCDMEQGYEDTMMGSHHGGRVTACSVRYSIFEYLMAIMILLIYVGGAGLDTLSNQYAGDLTLGQEGTSLASVRVPYDISPCLDELTIGYSFFGLKSLEYYLIGALVFFGFWSKAIISILRISGRPSRNIDRVISGHLRSGVSQRQ